MNKPLKVDRHRILRDTQPISWGRALLCGMLGSVFMMLVVDIFYMMGLTPFSFELYLGSLFVDTPENTHAWTIGFLLNLGVGGIFGVLYGYFFEYFFFGSGVRNGIFASVFHIALAAAGFFPFFNIIHEFLGTGLYPDFGFMASGLGFVAMALLILGHLAFGATLGLFYGPVREDRIRAQYFEPGESGVPPWDPQDRAAI